METEIKEALIALFVGINKTDGSAISREMARLDQLAEAGRGRIDAQLLHFLERRSYEKARLLLEGASDIPAGICGGRSGRKIES